MSSVMNVVNTAFAASSVTSSVTPAVVSSGSRSQPHSPPYSPGRMVWLALCASLLAGCTNLAPRHERPAAPVPTQLPVPAALAASAVGVKVLPAETARVPLGWQNFVRSPELAVVVQSALDNNRDLRVAVLNVQRAEAQLGITRADRLPTVSAGLTAASTPASGKQAQSYTAGLQVTAWEIDLFGRIANQTEAAQAQVLATEAGRRAAELSLVGAVVSSWMALVADTELLSVADKTASSREETLKLTQLRYDKGAASALELQSVQSLVAQARATQAQLIRQRDLDVNALSLLVGAPVGPALLPTAATVQALRNDAILAPVPVGLASETLLRRPDVMQAERQLIGANASIGSARAAFFPRLALTGSTGLASSQFSDLFKGGNFAWSLSTQALATLFDSGRNQANLEVAKVNRDIAVAQYEKAVQTAFRETADALAGLMTWREQLDAQTQQRNATQEIARLTELRYQHGAASELERLDAQRNLLAAEQAVVQVRLAEQVNRVNLFKALGV